MSSLQKLLFPPGWQRRPLKAVLWSYFDESGGFKDSDFICLGGFISGGEGDLCSWDKFTQQWEGLLIKRRIKHLHTSEFCAQKGEYRDLGLNSSEINDFLNAAAKVIVPNVYCGFSVTLDTKHYYALHAAQRKKLGEKQPERFLFYRLMRLITSFLEEINYPDPIAMSFDWSEDVALRCIKPLSHLIKSRHEIKTRIGAISFASDEQYYPLQAADLFCWGISQHLTGNAPEFFRTLVLGYDDVPPGHFKQEHWSAEALAYFTPQILSLAEGRPS